MKLNINEIRARCEAATKGLQDANAYLWNGEQSVVLTPQERCDVVAALSDIPALLAEVERLEKERADWEPEEKKKCPKCNGRGYGGCSCGGCPCSACDETGYAPTGEEGANGP